MLKIKIETEENKISTIQILGDFFVYPEESLFELEKGLVGASKEECLGTIKSLIAKHSITIAGFSANDLHQLISQAFSEAS